MIKKILVLLLISNTAHAYDELRSSLSTSMEGMRIQNERLKIISQNIANANSTGKSAEEEPYRRKILLTKNHNDLATGTEVIAIDKIARDKSDFKLVYDPAHPAANAEGYVRYPNVDTIIESVDAKEAQRSFEANMMALDIAKSNQSKLIEAMK
jgi:flagellar basal-body rod protein FlgC